MRLCSNCKTVKQTSAVSVYVFHCVAQTNVVFLMFPLKVWKLSALIYSRAAKNLDGPGDVLELQLNLHRLQREAVQQFDIKDVMSSLTRCEVISDTL